MQQFHSVAVVQYQERDLSHYCLMYSYVHVSMYMCTQHACVLYLHVIIYELSHGCIATYILVYALLNAPLPL
jgi:hypothetical protein